MKSNTMWKTNRKKEPYFSRKQSVGTAKCGSTFSKLRYYNFDPGTLCNYRIDRQYKSQRSFENLFWEIVKQF